MSNRQSFGFNRSRTHHPPVMQQSIQQSPPTLIEMVSAIYQTQQEILNRLDEIERRLNPTQPHMYSNHTYDQRFNVNNPYNQQPLIPQQQTQPPRPSTNETNSVFN